MLLKETFPKVLDLYKESMICGTRRSQETAMIRKWSWLISLWISFIASDFSGIGAGVMELSLEGYGCFVKIHASFMMTAM